MNTVTIIVAVAGILFGGGGIIAFVKVRREANNISVMSAEKAVGAVTDAMATLKTELDRAQARIANLEGMVAANAVERERLLEKIETLEGLIREVQEGVNRINGEGREGQ